MDSQSHRFVCMFVKRSVASHKHKKPNQNKTKGSTVMLSVMFLDALVHLFYAWNQPKIYVIWIESLNLAVDTVFELHHKRTHTHTNSLFLQRHRFHHSVEL